MPPTFLFLIPAMSNNRAKTLFLSLRNVTIPSSEWRLIQPPNSASTPFFRLYCSAPGQDHSHYRFKLKNHSARPGYRAHNREVFPLRQRPENRPHPTSPTPTSEPATEIVANATVLLSVQTNLSGRASRAKKFEALPKQAPIYSLFVGFGKLNFHLDLQFLPTRNIPPAITRARPGLGLSHPLYRPSSLRFRPARCQSCT